MDSRLLATIIIFPIWLALVLVFRKHRQWLLYYMFGAFGLTLMLVFMAEYLGIDQIIVNFASFHVNILAKHFHMSVELLTSGRFQLFLPGGGSSVLKLGIECSALLESSILIGLIAFYPLFDIDQKVLRIVFGIVMTYVLNLARLMIIVYITYKYGPDHIFVAHAFIGRAFFFVFELMLYWWLMTKPSVKVVGDAINLKMPLSRAAKIGVSLKRYNTALQVIVIAIVVGFSTFSVIGSPEKSKILGDLNRKQRPIIYQEETGIAANNQAAKNKPIKKPQVAAAKDALPPCIGKDIPLNLEGGEKTLIKLEPKRKQKLLVKIAEGENEIAARLFVNGSERDFITAPSWVYLKDGSLFDPIAVNAGDLVEIKFQNIAEDSSRFLVKVLPLEEAGEYSCKKATKPEMPTPTPVNPIPIATPSPLPKPTPTPTPAPSPVIEAVRGVTSAVNQEMRFTLAAKEESSFKFNIGKEEKLNVEISDSDKLFSGQIILNGQVIDLVTSTADPSGATKFSLPVHVDSGDTLEVKLTNLTDKPSLFLLKLVSLEGSSDQ